MRGEPTIVIYCDHCDVGEETFTLTACARQSYDCRDLKSEMMASGWESDGKVDTCPECVDRKNNPDPDDVIITTEEDDLEF